MSPAHKNTRYRAAVTIDLVAYLHAHDAKEADERIYELFRILAPRLTGNIAIRGRRLHGEPVLDYRGATFTIEPT